MRLLKLTLENFRQFKSKVIEFSDKTNICGFNGAGKTTIYDAYCWLLTGKDSQDKKDVENRSIINDGDIAHNIVTSVTGFIEIDGKPHKLKRIQKEKWTTKNGTQDEKLTGLTTVYEIDDRPNIKEKDWLAWLAENIKIDLIRLTSDPLYFPKLDWKEQREILLARCGGEISDELVFDSNKELRELKNAIGDHSIEVFSEINEAKYKSALDSIKEIPGRIDEQTRMLSGIEDAESIVNSLNEQICRHQNILSKLNQERAGIVSGAGIEAMKLSIDNYKLQLNQLNEEHKTKRKDAVSSIDIEIQKIKDSVAGSDQTISKLRYQYTSNKSWTDSYTESMNELRESWTKVNAKEFDENNLSCPTCGAHLSEEKAAALKAEFNEKKATELKEITDKGKSLKEKVEALKKENEGLLLDINKHSVAEENARTAIAKLNTKKDETLRTFPTVENQQDYILITQKIDELLRKINMAKEDNSKLLEEIDGKINEAKKPIDALRQKISDVDSEFKRRQRIIELTEEKKQAKIMQGEASKYLALCDLFETTKMDMLNSRVSEAFPGLTFKLYHRQKNEGLKKTCEVKLDGKPYGSLSRAEERKAGMFIIKSLRSFYNVNYPIWVDDSEGIFILPEVEGQLIRLYATQNDQELRIENN